MTRIVRAAWLLLMLPVAAHAAPSISFTWDGCTGPVQKDVKGKGVYSIYVSATGMDQPHWAYEAQLLYANAGGTLPDAWRFDKEGCQKGLLTFQFAPAAAETTTCPPLYGHEPIMSIHATRPRNPEDPGDPTTSSNLVLLAVAYNHAVTSDPDKRYFLCRIDFDHGASVEGAGKAGSTCGGLEQGIVFTPVPSRCNYLVKDAEGVRHEMQFEVPKDPLVFGSVPKTKWGQIVNQHPR